MADSIHWCYHLCYRYYHYLLKLIFNKSSLPELLKTGLGIRKAAAKFTKKNMFS